MSDHADESIAPLVGVVRRLLGEGGCPWDRDQSLESLRPYLLEETHEALEAIDHGDPGEIREELGDVLFLLTFMAELTRAKFGFSLGDIAEATAAKMTRRHPWVFADADAETVASAIHAWEAQKKLEKRERGRLSGVPVAMPALLRAHRVGEKASAVGYDWTDAAGVRAKVDEELIELDDAVRAGDSAAVERELGDVLFALASFGRKSGIDAESALRGALDRFSARFRHVELAAERDGLTLVDIGESAREALWDDAKRALALSDAVP